LKLAAGLRAVGLAAVGLVVAGCAAPIIGAFTVGQIMTALSLTTTVVTGRGTVDIALGLVSGQDCRLIEGALRQDRDFCEEPDSPATAKDFRGLAGLIEDAKPPSAATLAAARLRQDYDWTTVPLIGVEVPAEPVAAPTVVATVAVPVARPTRGATAGLSEARVRLAELLNLPPYAMADPLAGPPPPPAAKAVRPLAMAERELAAEFAPRPRARRAPAPAAPRPFAERQPDTPPPRAPATPLRVAGLSPTFSLIAPATPVWHPTP